MDEGNTLLLARRHNAIQGERSEISSLLMKLFQGRQAAGAVQGAEKIILHSFPFPLLDQELGLPESQKPQRSSQSSSLKHSNVLILIVNLP